MNYKRLRVLVPLAVTAALTLGLILNLGTGTLSAFGWREVSLLCPLGALMTMLAEKIIVPRAVLSLLAVVVIVLLTGRAFCGWVCPAPLVSKLRTAFSRKARTRSELLALQAGRDDAQVAGDGSGQTDRAHPAKLTEEERALLRGGTEAGCSACRERFSRVDSRHMVLGGAVLSAAVFGFPIFCLVCPVGLTFGTIFLLIALFGNGDVTWSVVIIPALLLVEMVFFRKWCAKICPMGAFLSLVSKANRTLRPRIDETGCLEKRKGVECGACTRACEQGINLRDPSLGASASECTRCMACVQACPTGSIGIRMLAGAPGKSRAESSAVPSPLGGEGDDDSR